MSQSNEIRYSLPESDYNNLIQAYHLISVIADLLRPNVDNSLIINPVSFGNTLDVIEGLAESVFSAEIIKNEQA